ncbi:LOW QUALITY PROTEIN: VPS10 domain-containing receptor SorCS3 [Melanotaenia boesemani]|uniref:LOW QUALITY PROTEIN: VPS10 domain-containing receptor SorCS3 n=1 Tax=Melanotaenia boesemani TaxID=1250792 RepID=UPI001C03EEA2|nr:LOW QUALITY PROTEIN: VPS10 domain-containing receptor SorCS3 [Melanotaenia boesemani]
METWAGFCPGLHFSLGIWVVIAAYALLNAEAEITCASCPLPVQLHQEELQLGIRADPTEETANLRSIQVEFKELGVTDQNAGMDGDREAAEDDPQFRKDASWGEIVPLGSSKESVRGSYKPEAVEDAALRRAKRSGSELAEFTDQAGVEAGAEGNRGSMLDGHRSGRSEFRWNRENGRGTGRQDEPKLTSSTFALTGDSAHNHAVVYWSGQNSSVILILTKLYDFHIGSVTESTLWRSTDYGSTYERMNDKVGFKTVLSYLYVLSSNKKKIMVLTDPEFESSVLISTDEGASFQKYRLSFYILSLLFHPTMEDWALAYSHDQKLYSSVDFGRKWQLIHEHVTPNRFYWSVAGLDKEPDLIHMEAHTPDGNVQYITCKVQMCNDANRNYPFPGYIDISSLVVQDDYIFIQVPTSGRATYYVSYKRDSFIQIKLPKYSLPKDLHIVSTDEKQVFAAVQEWNQNDTYNLYLSDTRGIYFTLAMENVKTTRGISGNQMLDLYEVAGIKGMLIANKRQDNQVKTYITYNKGRDWRLLQAPAADLDGNDIHCILPFCSLHLQLQTSENPYVSGTISTKSSAPGIIVATGNIGPELSYNNVGMFISSDAGNSWRPIFEEEHNIWFLDKGGALVAVKQPSVPTRHLWVSFDEGRQWTQHSFSSVPLFVDGVLVEAGAENQIMTFFGHFSHRSEWQLIKIDYKSIFSKKCTEEDYQTWHLHNQGEPCVMGQKQIYMKRRPGNYCMLGKDYSRILSAESCICRAHDFECDYGYERRSDGNCRPAFWFNPSTVSRSCSQGQNYFNSTGYRKVVLNNCTKGVKEIYTARKQQCPNRPPKGLVLTTKDAKLTATLGSNVTFLVHLDEGDSIRTNIQLDFGDGTAVSYSNLSWTEEGIKHMYKSAGIFRVTALAENTLGYDTTTLFLHVTCPVEHVQLLAPFVVIRNKEVNITAVVLPSQSRTVTYFWWLGNNTEPAITLDGSISYTFTSEGMHTITVQVSAANTILQDTKTIAVKEFFKSLLLSFSPNLDEFNPDIPEWRQDVGRVIKKALLQVSDFPEEQMLVAVFPGVPTAAELFLLPSKNQSEGKKKSEEELEQASGIIISALNQNLVEFELKPGVRVIVYNTQLTLAPLVDSSPRHSSSAMLMLLSVVFLGLAVFLIYKFKRKIPWINIYAEVNQEKEQEMIGSVGQGDSTPKITLSEFTTSKELMEKELDARVKRGVGNACESTREIPNCTSV